MSPVKGESTNTVTSYQQHDYRSLHCYSFKVATTVDTLVYLFLTHISLQSVLFFFWSIINPILFLLLLLFCCKRIRKELHICGTCVPHCPSLMADFPNMLCHMIWGLSQHTALRSHYQCNWHSRVS